MTSPAEFFSALYPEPQGGFVVFCVPTELSTWVRAGQWDDAITAAQRYASLNWDVYFGTGLQQSSEAKRDARERGGSRTVIQIPFLHADVDCESPGKPNEPSIDEAYEALYELPIQPSVVVRSGWGLQPYWLLREPLDTSTDEGRKEAEKLMGGWQQHIRDAWATRGWKLDSTGDLARVLRFPGTFNLKHGQRREVKVDLWMPDRRYNPSDFTEYLGEWTPRRRLEPAGDWQPLSEACAVKVCALEMGLAVEAMARGEERHGAILGWAIQIHHAHVPFTVAVSQGQILAGIARAMPRERDRKLKQDEVYSILCDVYENQPGVPSARAEAVIREHGTAKDQELCTPVVVLGGNPLGKATGTVDSAETTHQKQDSVWLTPAQALRLQKNVSKRYPTKIQTLDALTRGGIQRGRLLTLIGRPGAGKTGGAIQMALDMQSSDEEAHVGFLMADEGLGPAVIRMAQRHGYQREELEAAHAETINQAADALETIQRVWCIDPDSPGVNVETFISGMAERANGSPQIWVIDSVQVVKSAETKGQDRRVSTAMIAELVKREGRRAGAIVILLSQSNRAAYKNKNEADNSDPLSAGAESGAIEHMADVLLFIAPDGDEGRVKVQVPKNRLGKTRMSPFYLDWDHELAIFREVDEMLISAEVAAERAERQARSLSTWKEKILQALREHPMGLSRKDLAGLTSLSNDKIKAAGDDLKAKGDILLVKKEGRGGGWVWRLN